MQAARAARRKAKILEGGADRMQMVGGEAILLEKSRIKLEDEEMDPALARLNGDAAAASRAAAEAAEAEAAALAAAAAAVEAGDSGDVEHQDVLDSALDDVFDGNNEVEAAAVATEGDAAASDEEPETKARARARPARGKGA
jgi:hypothetical protein